MQLRREYRLLSSRTIRKSGIGFTIVELLIVIVIIGILASITIVAYNGVQGRAQAASVADGFRKIEKGLRLLNVQNGASSWPLDNVYTGSNNPTITSVIANSQLGNYVQKEPKISGYAASNFHYDNEGDSRNLNACDTNATGGVNLFFDNPSAALIQAVDNIMDDGNTGCGRLRHQNSNGNNRIQYVLTPAPETL